MPGRSHIRLNVPSPPIVAWDSPSPLAQRKGKPRQSSLEFGCPALELDLSSASYSVTLGSD